jgi:2-deoxystreptamine N-acetyl-D-glucosaminyltransferase/2-deoxystreptamine glucosyltransferase
VARRGPGNLHVLRLASVFEPDAGALDRVASRFDPIGGLQNHTAALSRCLDRAGVRQTVLTSRLAAPAGARPLGELGVIHRVGVRTTRMRQLWAAAALPRVLRARGIDIVHAHQGEDVAVLLLGLLAAAVHRCPLVVTVHCSVAHTLRETGVRARLVRSVGGLVERKALRRAAAVLVLVPRTAALVVADGVPAGRVHVLPSGYEPRLFEDPGPDPFPELPHPRVGYVGRLAAQKAPHRAVQAFAGVDHRAHLVVVGDGPLRQVVDDAVAASPARDRITCRGFVPHREVPAVLAALDVLVLPSVYEEMGSVLVEAMASGLPVVATHVGGIPEVVCDRVTGILVPPGDVPALATAIDELVRDEDLRTRLGAAARERAGRYSWPCLAARVEQVYAAVREPAAAPHAGMTGPGAGTLPS